MDPFNWFVDCRKEGSLSDDEIRKILMDDDYAKDVFMEFVGGGHAFVEWFRTELSEWRRLYEPKKR